MSKKEGAKSFYNHIFKSKIKLTMKTNRVQIEYSAPGTVEGWQKKNSQMERFFLSLLSGTQKAQATHLLG